MSRFFLKLLPSRDIWKNVPIKLHELIFEGLFEIIDQYLPKKKEMEKKETRFRRSQDAEKSDIKMMVFPINPCTFSLFKVGTFLMKIDFVVNKF